MQTDVEILLKLLSSEQQVVQAYLPAAMDRRAFDMGGLFIPTNASQVVFYVGQSILTDAAQMWPSDGQERIQQLCGLLWLISEYGGAELPASILLEEDHSYHYKGIRSALREDACFLQQSKGYGGAPLTRSFAEVFMRDSFELRDGA